MTDYTWGVLTSFLALAGFALAIGGAYFLAAAARYIWGEAHYALMARVDIKKNRPVLRLKGEPEDEKPEYWDAATELRDALLESPRMYSGAGLGWRVLLVREARDEETL
jgi:hypothetical protein